MPANVFIYLLQYALFVDWFETYHHTLFSLYVDKVGFPVDEKGVQLQYWKLKNNEMTILNRFKSEYYQSYTTCIDKNMLLQV